MRSKIRSVLLEICFAVILAGILFSGFKWTIANLSSAEVTQLRPWQPVVRAGITVALFALACVFGGAFIRGDGCDS